MRDEPDDFVDWLRHSDPVEANVSQSDELVRKSCRRWKQLSGERQRRQRLRLRTAWCLAASLGLVAASALSWLPNRYQVANDHAPTIQASAEHATTQTISPEASADHRATPDAPESVPADGLTTLSEKQGQDRSSVAPPNVRPQRPANRLLRTRKRFAKPQAFPTSVWFDQLVRGAGKRSSDSWNRAAIALASQPLAVRREVMDGVVVTEDLSTQGRAMDLVCDSMPAVAKKTIGYWLRQDQSRREALVRAVQRSDSRELLELVPFVVSESDRELICRAAWDESSGAGLQTLVDLASLPSWQKAVRVTAQTLPEELATELVLLFRQPNHDARAAVAWVLSSIPDDAIDRFAAKMILAGRHRQPAYLALMARQTPMAREFLDYAQQQQSLSPALHSARIHFAVLEPHLNQWNAEPFGETEDENQQSRVTDFETLDRLILFDDGDHGGDSSFGQCG